MALRSLVAISLLLCAPARAQEGGSVSEPYGTARYAVPILVPPGNAGHQPEIGLAYDSSAAKGAAGWVGVGWRLGGPGVIARSTVHGVPYDYARPASCSGHPCYAERFALDGQELVFVGLEDGGARRRYRARRDDGRRIHYVPGADRWEIRTRDGRLLVFGDAPATRVVNPKNAQTFSWHLTSDTDVFGNWIRFEYSAGDGVLYPAAVSYSWDDPAHPGEATRRIAFVLDDPQAGARPDVGLDYRAGFRQAVTRRLARIDVEAGRPLARVTSYLLSYDQEPFSNRSRLREVRRRGSDGSLLGPWSFDYTETRPGFAADPRSDFAGACDLADRVVSKVTREGTLSYHERRLIDLDGDSLVDLYDGSGGHGADARACLNDGERLSAPVPWWSEPGFPYRKTSRTESWIALSGWVGLDTLDLNGDAFPDVVEGMSPAAGLTVRLGSATGLQSGAGQFGAIAGWDDAGISIASLPDQNGDGHPNRRISALLDLTGDGRADLVRVQGPSLAVRPALAGEPASLAYRPDPLAWLLPHSSYLLDVYAWGYAAPLWVLIETLMYDINGDGLLDHVDHVGPEDEPTNAFNYGAGFEAPAYHAQESLGLSYASSIGPTPSGVICLDQAVLDLNGDGCVDHVEVAPGELEVAFGTCEGRTLDQGLTVPWPAVTPPDGCLLEPEQLVDVDGDGLPDYVHDLDTIYLNPNLPPGLLLTATSPVGQVVEFSYAAAAQERPDGQRANPALPFPRMVVKQLTLRDSGARGAGFSASAPIVDRFEYHDADYARDEREFRGFGRVRRARLAGAAEDSQAIRTYASGELGRACLAQVVTEELFDGERLIRRTLNRYDASRGQDVAGSGRWEKCLLAEQRIEHLEGLGDGARRIVRTEYEWQQVDPFNLLSRTEWGEEVTLGDAVDDSGDGRRILFDYVADQSLEPTSPYLVSTLSRVRVVDPPTTLQPATWSEVEYSYSVQDSCPADGAPGRAVPGRPTRRRGWLDRPVRRPVDLQRTCYDATGNPTLVRGPGTPSAPGGAYGRTEYEPLFRTFPGRITRGDAAAGEPVLTTEWLYGHEAAGACALTVGQPAPPGLGLPCRETSPQGVSLRTSYDSFGRITRVQEPSDGWWTVVRSFSYELPHDPRTSAGTVVTTSVSSSGLRLVSRAHHDGLGRLVRTEEPGTAEPPEVVYVERSYDHSGRLSRISLPSTTPPGPFTPGRRFEYDALGRPTRRVDFDGSTEFRTRYEPLALIDEVYFGATRVRHERRGLDGRERIAWLETFEDATGPGDPGGGYRTRLVHDPEDRLVRVEDPIRSDPSLCQPSARQPLDLGPHCGAPGRHESRVEYDSLGRRTLVVDPDAGTTRLVYDDAGLIEAIHFAEGTPAALSSRYAYDALGRITRREFSGSGGTAQGISDATFAYHGTGSGKGLLWKVDADRPEGTDYTYTYDAAGRLSQTEQVTDRLRFVTRLRYDALGRPFAKILPDGYAKAHYYNGSRMTQAGLVKGIQYDALGRPIEYLSGSVRFRYRFDPVTTRLEGIEAFRGPVSYLALDLEFDGLGRNLSLRGRIETPGSVDRSFEYDGLGRLTRATGEWERAQGVATPVTWQLAYDPLGNLRSQLSEGGRGRYQRSWRYDHPGKPRALESFIEVTNGWSLVQEAVSVDAAGRTDRVVRSSGSISQTLDYQWNQQGLFQRIGDSEPGHFYDVFGNRVMQRFGPGRERVIYVGDDFEYNDLDGWGNTLHRLGGQVVATTGRQWTAPAQAALAPALVGALRGLGWILLGSGGAGLLLGLAGPGRRRCRPSRAVWLHAWAATGLGTVLVTAPLPLAASPALPDGPGSHGTHRADLLVYVRDHLGSVRLVIDYPEGGVVERRDYGPFGEALEQHGTFELQHQFTGQRHDASSGLEFFNARMLDRRWGRFISPDPLVAGLDAERLNRFSYVRNRPTSLVDPSGLCDVDDCITVVATPLLPRFAYVDGIALPLSAVPANAVLTGWVTGPYGAGTRIADSKLTAAELFGRENTAPPREDGSDGSHVDPQADLGAAYLVSRPLGFFRGASHNFVVTRAGFLGDPTARVYSYGETEAFFLGRVDESTVGFSAGTYEADVAAWLDLRGSSLPDRNALLIPASSRQVEAWAARLLEGYHDYSLFGGSAGPNSSTAAQAIANRAAGRSLPVPGSPRLAPGADSWRVIEFAPER